MAWHSGKPADSDFLSASVQHIRENFAELEPLHPHIAELVDLTALQPHIATILDSRIVDHNLDVTDPPNGWYVRWDNGLQICSVRIDVGEYTSTRTEQGITIYRWNATWTFPAVFLQVPHVLGTCSLGEQRLLETVVPEGAGGTREGINIFVNQISAFNSGYVNLIAVGRWK